jgi:hypothetical protein
MRLSLLPSSIVACRNQESYIILMDISFALGQISQVYIQRIAYIALIAEIARIAHIAYLFPLGKISLIKVPRSDTRMQLQQPVYYL